MIERVEAVAGVKGVVIGRSQGGKSLGRHGSTGALRIQRREANGFKAVIQSARGIQELFILVDADDQEHVRQTLDSWPS